MSLASSLLAPGPARADIFSPGDLSRPHAKLEGLDSCTRCHPAGEQLSQGACLSCHTELSPRTEKGLGLHGRLQGEHRDCERCHHEHQGRDFELIDWGDRGQRGFQHTRTGWPLEGKHGDQQCTACHEPRLMSEAARTLRKLRPGTMLGLRTACGACHFDEHRGQTEPRCESCHVEKAWAPAPGFDHGKTRYPLLGLHRKVKCTQCHPDLTDEEQHGFPAPRSETYLKLEGMPFQRCQDCHDDPHQGRFGQRCQSCHTPEGWTIIRQGLVDRAFHQQARFPLEGAHADVDCKACHGPWRGEKARFKNMQFNSCGDCHPDGHQGQLAAKGQPGPDCASCHGVEGFIPVRYGLAEHARTRYPLEGGHATASCDGCHPRTPRLSSRVPRAIRAELRRKRRLELFSVALLDVVKPLDTCEGCHRDPHGPQFAGRAGGCTACHRVEAFSSLVFEHQRDSTFPLEGAHRKVECEKCHVAASPRVPVTYRGLPSSCGGCHPDVHAGQLGPLDGCERCHLTSSFTELRFEHRPPFTAYALDGAHEKVACAKCHPAGTGPRPEVKYRGLPTACEGCHHDEHEGAFAGFAP